jgi:hypothetical protein
MRSPKTSGPRIRGSISANSAGETRPRCAIESGAMVAKVAIDRSAAVKQEPSELQSDLSGADLFVCKQAVIDVFLNYMRHLVNQKQRILIKS